MQPAILILPKELKGKVEITDATLAFMHFVAVIDGWTVRILKNRFDSKTEIPLSQLGEYLSQVIYLGAGLYSQSDSVE